MSKSVGEPLPEPEPEPEPSPYQDALFSAHDELQIYPPYPQYVNTTREFEVRLFDDFESIEIEATLYGDLVKKYIDLDKDDQFELADRIEHAIGRTASRLLGEDSGFACKRETVVLINNLPVIFEPANNAMLVGRWGDQGKNKMNIRSEFIEDRNQQRLLLGGLAAFVTYLEQR
jgi:hypothetical protein